MTIYPQHTALASWRQTDIEQAQIVHDRFQPDLPQSTGSASPVFRKFGGPQIQARRAREWSLLFGSDKGDQRKTGAVDGWYLTVVADQCETEPPGSRDVHSYFVSFETG